MISNIANIEFIDDKHSAELLSSAFRKLHFSGTTLKLQLTLLEITLKNKLRVVFH